MLDVKQMFAAVTEGIKIDVIKSVVNVKKKKI